LLHGRAIEVTRLVAKRHRGGAPFSSANDGQRYFLPAGVPATICNSAGHILNVLAVEADDQTARLDTGDLGRSVWLGGSNERWTPR
jgi:hypothetical protein